MPRKPKVIRGTRLITMPPAKAPESTKKYVKRYVGSKRELKYYVNQNGASGSLFSYDTPIVSTYTLVSQGDTNATRDGDVMELTRFNMNFVIQRGANDSFARLIIFQWFKDSNVDVPGVSDIVDTSGGAGTEWNAPINHANRQYFNIIYDKIFVCDDVDSNNHVRQLTFNSKRFARKMVKFNAGATTAKNHLYGIWLSSVTDASGNEPRAYYYFKTNFKDV